MAIFSILPSSKEIDLKEDGKALDNKEGKEALTSLILMVGKSVLTFSWKACCSSSSLAMLVAVKLLRLAKDLEWVSN